MKGFILRFCSWMKTFTSNIINDEYWVLIFISECSGLALAISSLPQSFGEMSVSEVGMENAH